MAKEHKEEIELLKQIAANINSMEELLKNCSDHWGYEDPIYRFYHQSFKVYHLQEETLKIVGALKSLLPDQPLNPWFVQIIGEGTDKEFKAEDNDQWLAAT